MAKKPTAPEMPTVPTKLPKAMGRCADMLYDVKQARLAAEKYAETIKAEEIRITNHIIDNLPKGDTGAAGARYRAQVKRDRKWRVNAEKWELFYKWIAKTGRFDLLQKRLSDTAIADVMATMPKAKQPPAIEPVDIVKVSLTKVM